MIAIKGDDYKFGSRVDLFFPLGNINVKLNQKVKGNKQLLQSINLKKR